MGLGAWWEQGLPVGYNITVNIFLFLEIVVSFKQVRYDNKLHCHA